MYLLMLTACFLGGGEPDLVADEEPAEPLPALELGKKEGADALDGGAAPQRKPLILPGTNSGPAAPEPAVTADMCDDLEEGGEVKGPDCITADIQCGDTIVGHTVGGTDNFNTKFYEQKHCTPGTTDHNGGDERVYRLKMPRGEWTATVWLDTPCADLDLAGMAVPDNDTCPTIDQNVPRCDMWPAKRGEREKLELVNQKPTTWLLVVEGKNDEEGPFALHVHCEEGL